MPTPDEDPVALGRLADEYGHGHVHRAHEAGATPSEIEDFERLSAVGASLSHYADAREAGATHARFLEALDAIPQGADVNAGLASFTRRVADGAPEVDERWVWAANNALNGAVLPVHQGFEDPENMAGSKVVDTWVPEPKLMRLTDLVDAQLLGAADTRRSSPDVRTTGVAVAHLHSADETENWYVVELDRETGDIGAWHQNADHGMAYETTNIVDIAGQVGDDYEGIVWRDLGWDPQPVAQVGCAVYSEVQERLQAAESRVTAADYRGRPAGEVDSAYKTWSVRVEEMAAAPTYGAAGTGDVEGMRRVADHAEARADELVPVLERQKSERSSHPAGVTTGASPLMGVGRG